MSLHLKAQPSLEELDDTLFESFSKQSKVGSITLSQLREKITSQGQTNKEITKLILFALLACSASTVVYAGILALLGLFSVSVVLTILLGCSCLGVFYGSAFVFGKWFEKKKFFSFQKEADYSRDLFQRFNHSDTFSILNELKNSLSQKLENTQIQKYNLSVYDFIKEGISRLDGDFNKLKYDIDSSEKKQKFSFDPFRSFFSVVSELENAIESAKSIKIINE